MTLEQILLVLTIMAAIVGIPVAIITLFVRFVELVQKLIDLFK